MLPDFPTTKAEVMKGIAQRITALELQIAPVFARMSSYVQYEGRRLDYEQAEFGTKEQQAEDHQVPFQIRVDEVPHLFGQNLDDKLIGIATQTAEAKMKMFYARMDEATEQTGNRFNAEGKPISGKMLLDMMEKGEWGFDESGKSNMSFLVHPAMLPALKKASDEVENDPALKRRSDDISRRQYGRWLDRENRRELVD
jgi:hypothetical protein